MSRTIILMALLTTFAFSQEHGIEKRVANTSLLITSLPVDEPGNMQIKRVFSDLSFSEPIFLTHANDKSNRLFVACKNGTIYTFPNIANPRPESRVKFLDISSKVRNSGEQGLLGLAFDPNYSTNGKFYLHYSWRGTSPATTRISRFTNANPASNNANPGSEEILMEVKQPYSNHNGGSIAFGPDAMLYIGLGDGGWAGDPHNHGQDTKTLLGNILRIDVSSPPDANLKYHIPRDNPFYNGGPAGNRTRKEIYAYGLRNPWRFSFDKLHGHLIAADVGQNRLEEVDIITAGGNYGWKIMEGKDCFSSKNCNTKGLIQPIAQYTHSLGVSITGGHVYFGDKVPSLFGTYVYGDYSSGRIWGLRYDGSKVSGPHVLVNRSGLNIASFGQDPSGEVYVLDLWGGGIYVLRPAPLRINSTFPNRLSDIPTLLSIGKGIDQTNKGIIPYSPSSKLWSDGLLKERFIAIPGLKQIAFRNNTGWDFPEQSVLIKNFVLQLDESNPGSSKKRVETRLLYRKNSQWHGFSYEWNESGSDAVLLNSGKEKKYTIRDKNGSPKEITHLFPSRSQCTQCHSQASNGVLGLTTAQMNSKFHYPKSAVVDNQLRTLVHIGAFDKPIPKPDTLPAMPDPLNSKASLQQRARAYLAANCAMCHQPGGSAPTTLDLRWQTSNEKINAINVNPNNGDMGIPGAKIIFPGEPESSILLERMKVRDKKFQMPPLATSRADQRAIMLISDWIDSLAK